MMVCANAQGGVAYCFLSSLGHGGIPPAPTFRNALASAEEIIGGD